MVATAIAAAGVAVSAYGSYQQGKAQQQQAAYNAQVQYNNQIIAMDNARDVELRGREAVYDQRRAVARGLSTQRAAIAGAGLEVGVQGTTPQDLVDSMVLAGELDVMRLRNNIEREQRVALVQGASYAAQAGQFELQRSSISPFGNAFSTALTGLANNADILFPSAAPSGGVQ